MEDAISIAGHPAAEQAVAVVIALAAVRRRSGPPAPPSPRSQWAARSRLMRGPVAPGPDAWRASGLPG